MKRLLCLLSALLMLFTCGCGNDSNNECDHDYELVKTVDASCTEDGYKKYECSECGDSYKKEISKTGHCYENGICQNCGAQEIPNEQPPSVPPAEPDEQTHTVTILRKVVINGVAQSIDDEPIEYSFPVGQSTCNIFIPALYGYKYLRTDGFTFTPTESGDGSGYLIGNVSSDTTVTMWYENQVDTSRLDNLIADALTSQQYNDELKYTDDSWNAYVTALNNAKNITLTPNTQQKEITVLETALEEACTRLVIASDEVFINVENAAGSFNKGDMIGLQIQTSSNIPMLVFTRNSSPVTPDVIIAEIQTLSIGKTVKLWFVMLPTDEAGTFVYTVSYGSTNDSIEVQIK